MIGTHPQFEIGFGTLLASLEYEISTIAPHHPMNRGRAHAVDAPPLCLNAYETFAAYRLFDNIDSGRYLRTDGFRVADDAHLSTLFAL